MEDENVTPKYQYNGVRIPMVSKRQNRERWYLCP